MMLRTEQFISRSEKESQGVESLLHMKKEVFSDILASLTPNVFTEEKYHLRSLQLLLQEGCAEPIAEALARLPVNDRYTQHVLAIAKQLIIHGEGARVQQMYDPLRIADDDVVCNILIPLAEAGYTEFVSTQYDRFFQDKKDDFIVKKLGFALVIGGATTWFKEHDGLWKDVDVYNQKKYCSQ